MTEIVVNEFPEVPGTEESAERVDRPPTLPEIDSEATEAKLRMIGVFISGTALAYRVNSGGVTKIDVGDPGEGVAMIRIQRGLSKQPLFFMADPRLIVTEWEVIPILIAKVLP